MKQRWRMKMLKNTIYIKALASEYRGPSLNFTILPLCPLEAFLYYIFSQKAFFRLFCMY